MARMYKLLLTVFLFVGCSSSRYALLPKGQIVDKDNDRILMLFNYMDGDSFAYDWLYNTRPDTITSEHYVEIVIKKR